jgi:hypothetical protein
LEQVIAQEQVTAQRWAMTCSNTPLQGRVMTPGTGRLGADSVEVSPNTFSSILDAACGASGLLSPGDSGRCGAASIGAGSSPELGEALTEREFVAPRLLGRTAEPQQEKGSREDNKEEHQQQQSKKKLEQKPRRVPDPSARQVKWPRSFRSCGACRCNASLARSSSPTSTR